MSRLKTTLSALALALMSAAPLSAYSGEIYTVCKLDPNRDNFLALRSCGSSKCHLIQKLGPGTFLHTLEPHSDGRWREVIVKRHLQDESYSGPKGWVYDRYICKVQY
jgi:hypothetical protein